MAAVPTRRRSAAAVLVCWWCLCAAGLLLPAALADDANAAVEAAAARGEAVVLAAPGGGGSHHDGGDDEAAAAAAAAASVAPAELISLEQDGGFVLGANVRVADLAALVAGNVTGVPLTPAAYLALSWKASWADGAAKSKANVRGAMSANFEGDLYSDPDARLAGISGGNVLKPAPVVAFTGTLGGVFGRAERSDPEGPASAIPPVQPVVFGAGDLACNFVIEAVTGVPGAPAACSIFFVGRAATEPIAFKSALPPPLDAPILTGGPFADFVDNPTNRVRLGCVLEDPSAPSALVGKGCDQIFPPGAAAATAAAAASGDGKASEERLRRWRRAVARSPPQQDSPTAAAAAGGAAATQPSLFFGGGGGGGGGGGSLPANTTVFDSWGGFLGASYRADDLRALLNGSASSAAMLGPFPYVSINVGYTVFTGDFPGSDPQQRYASAAGTAEANFDGRRPLKAKLFGVPKGNPLKPSKVVGYAGLVAPRNTGGTRVDNGGFAGEKLPVSFTLGQPCSYVLFGLDDAGNFVCSVGFRGKTASAPTFPSLLADGAADVPLAPTALSNFVLRPTSLASLVCKLEDPSKPTATSCL